MKKLQSEKMKSLNYKIKSSTDVFLMKIVFKFGLKPGQPFRSQFVLYRPDIG